MLLSLLSSFIGGPHGWIPARTATRLKKTCGFPIAPREPGPNNMAARARVRITMNERPREIMDIVRNRPPEGLNSFNFPHSATLTLAGTDRRLRQLHISRENIRQRAQHADPHGGVRLKSTQAHAYELILNQWGSSDPLEYEAICTAELQNRLRRHTQVQFQAPPQEGNALANAWITNIRTIVSSVQPRVASTMLRCGLHGWFTEHRWGKGHSTACFICNSGSDSLLHISCCRIVRQLHRLALPHITHSKWKWLGHIREDIPVEDRVMLAICTHAAHECRREFYHGGRHTHTHADHDIVTRMLHHMSAALAGRKNQVARAIAARIAACRTAHNPPAPT